MIIMCDMQGQKPPVDVPFVTSKFRFVCAPPKQLTLSAMDPEVSAPHMNLSVNDNQSYLLVSDQNFHVLTITVI